MSLIRRVSEVDTTTVDSRCVLYHQQTGEAIVLNLTGSLLWEELASPRTAQDLTATLLSRFPEISQQQATEDTQAFVDEVAAAGLVQIGG